MDSKFSNAADFLCKSVAVTIDRLLQSKHPKHGWEYQLNYGFIPDTISPDGEELDAYIIGTLEPLKKFTGNCIAVIHRLDDNDDKLVVVTDDYLNITDEEIRQHAHFQEQWFTSEIIRCK